MRGKVKLPEKEEYFNGITPACAGKSILLPLDLTQRKDHPRVCGEKYMDSTRYFVKTGSPPRVRGKAET